MNKSLPIAVAVIVMVLTAWVQGRWSERWGTPVSSEEVEQWVSRMDNIPLEIGDWVGHELERDEEQFKASKASGSMSRQYEIPGSGRSVHVSLMCGTARNVAIHTPDKCYVAAGFNMVSQPEKFILQTEDSAAEFFTTAFTKEEIESGLSRMRIFWSWNADGRHWIAPGGHVTAKVPLSRHRMLYKLYIVTAIPSVSQSASENPYRDFIEQLLPVLNQALSPPEAEDQQTASAATAT